MRDLLFNVPWWIPAVISIAGVVLWLSGNRRQLGGIRAAGYALMLLAVAWAVVSYLVDTPKEICIKQTRQFVQAVVDRNWSTFDELMESGADFMFTGTSWQINGRQTIDADVKLDVDQIGLKGAHVSQMQAAENGGAIVIKATIWSEQEISMGRPLDSDWEFEWRQSGPRWLLHEVRGMRVANLSPDEVRGSLRKH